MIHIRDVTKQYEGQGRPAVDHVSLDVAAGEIVILVGPSGCGKTTTLKMINRLIEPTSGEILVAGTDVMQTSPKELRRRIGYVIQQVGLFPHMSVARNIALVPRMLSWDKQRIANRVDELLHLVGLDPAQYRNRRPRQLSGGQQQRVGVARALAADPPVLLMDEPFAATDPITRERLQNELLRLQAEIQKTIVFVTHDFDEAVKLGDRIAVLSGESRLAQYDTPDNVLAHPADDFVAQFVGTGAAVKRLTLAEVGTLPGRAWDTAQVGETGAALRSRLAHSAHDRLLLLDEGRRPVAWVTAEVPEGPVGADQGRAVQAVSTRATLFEALDLMLKTGSPAIAVTGEHGEYLHVVETPAIMAAAASGDAKAGPEPPAGTDGPDGRLEVSP